MTATEVALSAVRELASTTYANVTDTGRSTETVCRQRENFLVTREDLIGASALGLSMKWKMTHEKKSRWPDWRRGLASWTMPALWGVCDILPMPPVAGRGTSVQFFWERILRSFSFSREGCVSLKM